MTPDKSKEGSMTNKAGKVGKMSNTEIIKEFNRLKSLNSELLEALKYALEWMNSPMRDGLIPPIEEMKVAIAKAEWRT